MKRVNRKRIFSYPLWIAMFVNSAVLADTETIDARVLDSKNSTTVIAGCSSVVDISNIINADAYPQIVEGSLLGKSNDFDLSGCASIDGSGPDVIYRFTPDSDRALMMDLCGGNPSLEDSVLILSSGGACPGDVVLDCNDDGCGNGYGLMSKLSCRQYHAGTEYFLIVDSFSTDTQLGIFSLTIYECGVMHCPMGTQQGQAVADAEQNWSVIVSDESSSQGLTGYEDLTGVSGTLCNVGWWGLQLECCWNECSKDVNFSLEFYSDNNGKPGDLIISRPVTPERSPMDEVYGDGHLWYYSAELSPCQEVDGGWLALKAEMDSANTDCVFLWASSSQGDMRSAYWNGALLWISDFDLSLCLTGSLVEPTVTPTPVHFDGTLWGQVELERPGIVPPDGSWVIPINVTLCTAGLPMGDYQTVTDATGHFSIDLPTGNYDIAVKNGHTLSRRVDNITLVAGEVSALIPFGLLPEGDSDGDDTVTSLDFFIVRGAYNLSQGDPGYDDRGDFNEDHIVNSTDFFLLKSHYNQMGEGCAQSRVQTGSSFNVDRKDVKSPVTIRLKPDLQGFSGADTTAVSVWVNTDGRMVNSVDLHLNYQPEFYDVKIIQQHLKSHWVEMQSRVDRERGRIDYAAVSFNGMSESFKLCTLIFKGKHLQQKLCLDTIFEPGVRYTQVEFNGMDLCRGAVINPYLCH